MSHARVGGLPCYACQKPVVTVRDHREENHDVQDGLATLTLSGFVNPCGFRNLGEAFAACCSERADSIAFRCEDQALSYRQLDVSSASFAAFLRRELDLQQGDRLAIQLPNILAYPVVAWGALRAGVVIVNINPMYTIPELVYQLQDSGAKAIVVLGNDQSILCGAFAQTAVSTVISVMPTETMCADSLAALDKFMHCDLQTILARTDVPISHECSVDMDGLAALQYTGGTTGVSKGAMLSHGNLYAGYRLASESFPLPAGIHEIVIAPMPLYHVYGFTMNVVGLCLKGAESVLVTDPRDIANLVKVMRSHPFTGMAGINTLFIALLQHPEFEQIDFTHAVGIIAGGSALVPEVAQEWHQRTGSQLFEGYGLSETAATGTVNTRDNYRLGTVGKPIRETEFRVVDQAGRALPSGESGELQVRGPQVMQGYWRRPEETSKALDSDRWFSTGDVAVIDDDGFIRIVDRVKDMILVSGFNVFPAEVEAVLHQHPDVLECAVIGVPDARSGESVKAFVVSRSGTGSETDLRAFCALSLTPYKLPRHFQFVAELPKSAVGKILRRALRDQGDE